jgi:PAS domain S-box-containing protein
VEGLRLGRKKTKGGRQAEGEPKPASVSRGKRGEDIEESPTEGSSLESMRYFQKLIENALDLITILDREGRIVYNSPSLKRILGYEPAELNGMVVFELMHPDDLPELKGAFQRGIKTPGATEIMEYRIRHKNGSWRSMNSIGNNLLFDPVVKAVVVNSRDTTTQKLTEKALKESEEYFRAVIENAMDIIMIIDENATVKFVNTALKGMLGYDPEEIIGRNGFEFIHPDDLKMAMELVSMAARDPDYSPLEEIRVRHKNGAWRHLEGIGKNFLDHPAVQGIVTSFRDVTYRKIVEESVRTSEEMYKALVRMSPDGVTVADLQGNILFVSPLLLKLHGFEKEEELIGTSALELIAAEEQERANLLLQKTITDELPEHIEITLLRKDGTRFLAEVDATLIKDTEGNPSNLVSFTRDITERRRMEKELKDRNEELEAFAHTISHDLLTPVAIVEGYAKAALEADMDGRPDAERECLEAIARGAQRMSDLITSLLQFAQAGHMDIEVSRAEPEEILVEVLMDLEEDIRAKGAEISIAADLPPVKVDAIKLQQVFFNILNNAIKHMGDVPEPRIEIGAREESGMAVFYIRDNGAGIPPELHKRIFEPFKHFSLSGTPGLGIGLSSVKRAVTAWGGKVWVESTPSIGATFFFSAPRAD